MKRWHGVGLALGAMLVFTMPSMAQTGGVSVGHGPIINGRQYEPTRLGHTPPTVYSDTSKADQKELDDIYRQVMERSAGASAKTTYTDRLPPSPSTSR